jgi:hypothetical protein
MDANKKNQPQMNADSRRFFSWFDYCQRAERTVTGLIDSNSSIVIEARNQICVNLRLSAVKFYSSCPFAVEFDLSRYR